jgi:exodeoxyribonuclease VIII
MVDLETLNSNERSAIVSIGACKFSQGKIGSEFYKIVDLQSSVDAGLTMSPSTVIWWMQQGPEARYIFDRKANKTSLKAALVEFGTFIGTGAEVWGNGADFDNVILRNAYDAFNLPLPWKYWNNRCYRTIKGLNPQIKIRRTGTYHNALDDAKTQAEHLMEIMPNL